MSIDRSVQLPTKIPPTLWSSTTARASAPPRTPTISSWASLSRVLIEASSSGPAPQAGDAGEAGSGPASGVTLALATPMPEPAGAEVGAGAEQPLTASGTTVRTAAARRSNARLGIATCCHGERPSPTGIGPARVAC